MKYLSEFLAEEANRIGLEDQSQILMKRRDSFLAQSNVKPPTWIGSIRTYGWRKGIEMYRQEVAKRNGHRNIY